MGTWRDLGAGTSLAATVFAWLLLGIAEAADLFALKVAFLIAGLTGLVVAAVAVALERSKLAWGALLLALPAAALIVWWIRSLSGVEL